MPALDLSIALGVIGRGLHMTHPTNTDEFLEVSRYKLGAVIRNDSGIDTGEFFSCPLGYDLYIIFSHGFTDFPMNDIATVTVQNAAKVIKGPADVQVRYVYMPVFMGFKRLYKTISFTAGFAIPPQQKPGIFEHSVYTAGTHRNNVGIHQHIGQATVTILGVINRILHDGFFFPPFQPKIARNPAIMFVDFTVAFNPVVIFAAAYSN
jgi:hypothetical protein